MVCIMQFLISLWVDSFIVLGRNFVLLYPLLFFSLLMSMLVPETHELPTLDVKWVTLLSILLLLYNGFMAGWFNMITTAVVNYRTLVKKVHAAEKSGFSQQNAQELMAKELQSTDPFIEPWRLFKAFFPGVGEFFSSFVLGGGLQLFGMIVIVLGLLLAFQFDWDTITQCFEKFATFKTPEEGELYLKSLPEAKQLDFALFAVVILGSFALCGVFSLLTLFWSPLVIVRQMGALKAYGASIVQFFKDPIRIILIGTLYVMAMFISMVMMGTGSEILAMFFNFMVAVLKTYFSILVVMYVIRVKEKEELEQAVQAALQSAMDGMKESSKDPSTSNDPPPPPPTDHEPA
ncbi:MAG: hypothetical protein K2X66_16890 [Cyanobacteria bacterium]|nr:hypothetical protein [Cyanobacteriota bacterium]